MEFHHYRPADLAHASEAKDGSIIAVAEDKELGLEAALYFTGKDSLLCKVLPTEDYDYERHDWPYSTFSGQQTTYDLDHDMSQKEVEALLDEQVSFVADNLKVYEFAIRRHRETDFVKDGEPYSFAVQTNGNTVLLPTKSIDADGNYASVTSYGAFHDLGKDPKHYLEVFFSKGEIPQKLSRVLERGLYGGRNALQVYLDIESNLKQFNNFERTQPLVIGGEKITRETLARACYRTFGLNVENRFRTIDSFCGHSAKSREDNFHQRIYAAVRKLDKASISHSTRDWEDAGFPQKNKDEALRAASRQLARTAFSRFNAFEKCVAKNLEKYPFASEQIFEKAIQNVIFPKEPAKLTEKEKRLAEGIYQRLRYHSASPEYKADILSNLALGGDHRKQEIRSIERDRVSAR